MNETKGGNEFKSEEEAQAAGEFEESSEQRNETLESLATNPDTISPKQIEIMQVLVQINNLNKRVAEGNKMIEKAENEKYREWKEDALMQRELNFQVNTEIFALKDRLEQLLSE